jgi:hypothetical protein
MVDEMQEHLTPLISAGRVPLLHQPHTGNKLIFVIFQVLVRREGDDLIPRRHQFLINIILPHLSRPSGLGKPKQQPSAGS